ncbi:Guanylate kinase [subsurface metagenome]
MDVDVKGAKRLMKLYPDGLFLFIIPPDIRELEKRLLKRNTDEDAIIRKRLTNAVEEFKHKDDYKYIIENRELKQTIEKILSIIKKEAEGG